METTHQPRPYRGRFLLCLLILIVVGVRGMTQYGGRPNFVPFVLSLGTFTLLYLSEGIFSDRLGWYRFLYFPVQAGLVWVLSSLQPFMDVSNFLYIILSIQAIQLFSRQAAVGWMVLYTIMLVTAMVLGSGWVDGIVLSLSYLAAIFFVVSYDVLYVQAQSDEAESQALLVELQQANQELQEYAAQGEELAAARERNRLARDLHETVSQLVFSISLTARSAQLLLAKDPPSVSEQLDRLQAMTTDALSQLRSLITQMRPSRNPE
jgi:signal transduction histidine kinase